MLGKLALALLLSSALCPTAAAQTGPEWKTFAPEGEGFSIEMPGVPEHGHDKIPWPGSSATLDYDYFYVAINSDVYLVGYIDMPPSEKNMEKRLESGLNSVVRGALSKGGKEVSRRKVTSSFGCPQIAWVGSTPAIPVMEVHAFGSPSRFYIIISSTGRGARASGAAARFLDSFKVDGSPCGDKKAA
jgi:hypothetical protein